MKIALELQPMFTNRSGIGWYTYKLIKNLISENVSHEFSGVGFDFLGKNKAINEIRSIGLKNYTLNYFIPYSFYRRIYDCLPIPYNNLFNQNYSVYHFFNYIVPPRVKGIVINTVYDMTYKKYPNTMKKETLIRLNKELKRSVKRSQKIITISDSAKKDILEEFTFLDENRIEIVPPGVEIGKFNININGRRNKEVIELYRLPRKYFLYLGNIEPRKNIPTILKAYADFKKKYTNEYKLVLAGSLGWKYDEVNNLIKKLDISNDITFTGYLLEEHKAYVYKNASVFIYPTLYEGFGMPVLEAMASGVPVITSNVSSIPEVAGNGAIKVSPMDYDSISRNIYSIITRQSYRLKLINEGYKQCNKYSWEESARNLITIYDNLQ